MHRNVALALHAGTPAARNAITKYFSAQNYAYWHHIDDFWIVQVPDHIPLKQLSKAIEALDEVGNVTHLLTVLPIKIPHYGRAKPTAWDWMLKSGGVVDS